MDSSVLQEQLEDQKRKVEFYRKSAAEKDVIAPPHPSSPLDQLATAGGFTLERTLASGFPYWILY